MYVINDLDEFSTYVRRVSFEEFSKSNNVVISDLSEEEINDEIDYSISLEEVKNIILSNVTNTNDGDYKIKEETLMKILTEINNRIISNVLNNLVKKNMVEVAFDKEQNDFIFWVKDNIDRKQE